jgi:hypothetical protein
MAGRQFPLPTTDFNGVVSDLNYMKDEANTNGKYFDDSGNGQRIILKADGKFDACNVNTYDNGSYSITNYVGVVTGASGAYSSTNGNSCTASSCCSGTSCPYIQSSRPNRGRCVSIKNYDIPDDSVIFVEDNAWVEGTINNKKVTIVAANLIGGSQANVYVGINDILYTNFDGSDIIGILAQKNVTVVRDSQNYLTIDAALLAQSGRVGRDYYSSHSYDKNTITINGSLATKLRYGFAYTDGTGYTNRVLNFDNNLLYFPPPYFPTGTEYYIDLWDEI